MNFAGTRLRKYQTPSRSVMFDAENDIADPVVHHVCAPLGIGETSIGLRFFTNQALSIGLVETRRIELLTFALRTRRSPN